MIDNYVQMGDLCKHMSQNAIDKAYQLMPGLKGVLAYVFPYLADRADGNVSLYARGMDYHIVVKNELTRLCDELNKQYPQAAFAAFVDASPFPEVFAAAKAGLGVIGKNNLLITPEYGSFVFIGLIATDLGCTGIDMPVRSCINCGACIGACPTKALSEGSFEPFKCLSDITQRKGELEKYERELIKTGKTVWGCDVCQLVCPMNRAAKSTELREFKDDLISSLSASDIPCTNREFKQKYGARAFSWRGRAPLARNTEIQQSDE